MPATTSFIGYGCDFQLSTDGGSTYNTVGQVWELEPPDMDVADVKVSNLLSPNTAHEYRPGMLEPGTAKFVVIFKKADLNNLYNQVLVTGLKWRFVYSDISTTASRWDFNGHLKKISGKAPMEDKVIAEVTIKITQKPVFTQGT